MKRILAIILLVGVIMGPGYLFYCYFFSGSSIGDYPAFSQEVNKLSMGGMRSVKKSNATWHTPILLSLSPDMNPISLCRN